MKKLLIITSVLSVLNLSVYADSVQGEIDFKACSGCHGKTGEKHALGKSKIIKDLSKQDIVAALNGYKNGTYGGSMKAVMKGQVSRLDEKKIDDISDFIGKKDSSNKFSSDKIKKQSVEIAKKTGSMKCGSDSKKVTAKKCGAGKCGGSTKNTPSTKCGSK